MIKNKKQIIILISWLAVLFWMIVIFNLSSQAAEQSDKLSKGIVAIIVEIIEKIVPGHEIVMNGFNYLLRKSAHFLAYLVLGVLVLNALKRSGVKGLKSCVLALGICVLYAVSDEIHQLYVPGRSGQALDVMIDSTGAIIGIAGRIQLDKKLEAGRKIIFIADQ